MMERRGYIERLLTNGQNITYTSNSLNQYVEVNDVNFFYDKNGNLLTVTGGPFYDCENRLMGFMTGKNINYRYDFAGKRVVKSRFNPQPYTITQYTYDGEQIIADYNAFSGVLLRKYIYGPGIDEPICMLDVQNGNAVYYYHFDGLGSVVALSNGSGNLVEKYKYDVFGKPIITDQNGVPRVTSDVNNRYLFTGREYDSETGNYYYRARYYHPTLGRFMQVDPLRMGFNFYTYVDNRVTMMDDPTGEKWYDYIPAVTCWKAVFGGGFGTSSDDYKGCYGEKDCETCVKKVATKAIADSATPGVVTGLAIGSVGALTGTKWPVAGAVIGAVGTGDAACGFKVMSDIYDAAKKAKEKCSCDKK